jgi:serine/threonine-protein kinase
LEALFWAALKKPPDQREAFLAVQCPDDPDLRRKLQRMLAADERQAAFLEIPLPEVLTSGLPRTSVARWKLLESVGEDGLGVVYRAECLEDGVRLEAAIKILRPGFDTGKFHEKFVKERQILAGLDHPGIVRLMDCGADSYGRSFLVMEFIEGEPLNAHLERANTAIPQRLELFESICEAVSYLHSRLIIHGDIKPANVLVTMQAELNGTVWLESAASFYRTRTYGREPHGARARYPDGSGSEQPCPAVTFTRVSNASILWVTAKAEITHSPEPPFRSTSDLMPFLLRREA